MDFPERFSHMPEYAFPRLRALLDSHQPGGDVLPMSIGEPRQPMPAFVAGIVAQSIGEFAKYPANDGTPGLLNAISGWIGRRYCVDVGPERIMALNGTREGLFNTLVALAPEFKNGKRPAILIPNPFYQVYAVAAAAVGAEPVFVPASAQTGFLPDYASLPGDVLNRTVAAYLCSPSNPQGAVAPRDYLAGLLGLAETHDFRLFADECYSEIWREAPPPGALQVGAEIGTDPERVAVFHSLSKRSNLPGLRSGFVATGPQSMRHVRRLRAYAGAPLPQPLQRVAERVWSDEEHVIENRRLYGEKYQIAAELFSGLAGFTLPEGGIFLWLPVGDGETAALKLWRETGIRVLPGAYLAREVNGDNPGKGYVRVALVAPKDETRCGLVRLRDCLYGQGRQT